MTLTPDDIKTIRRLARLEAHAYAEAAGNPLFPIARSSFDTTTGRFNVPSSWPVNRPLTAADDANGGDPFA
ncbi:hypothetical protein M3667_01850 [Microbacterium sp. P26]|uniref:hypothetical protein n=1 Tax=Microbacterium TaxID=33882 RepID=UPI00203DF213|nr:hypothetical protein [Microbacterium sp. P26]MCM3500621.1 hypothetical protein [Microbacterium sp. P26]